MKAHLSFVQLFPGRLLRVGAAALLGLGFWTAARAESLPDLDQYNTTPNTAAVSVDAVSPSAPVCGPFDVPRDPGNLQPYGQCTYWIEEKRPDLMTNAVWKYKHSAVGGGAWDWKADADAAGYPVDHAPRAGDVAAYPPGGYLYTTGGGVTWSAGPTGHVAYVERVNADGSFVLSEMNVGWPSHGDIVLASAEAAATTYFIHLPGSSPAAVAPTVTINADVKTVAENGDAVEVAVTRAGSTAGALTVTYSIKGNAVAGTHYDALSGSVTIPAGSATGTIRVQPRSDRNTDGTHKVKLILAPGDGYTVGSPAQVKIKILNAD